MNVGQAAEQSGLPAKTIRYYEEIGLIAPERRGNGYRSYGEAEVQRLAFLKRARDLGFSIEDCRQLVGLHDDTHRASADVRRLALQHVAAIEDKIAELQAMHRTLTGLVAACHGDARPECAILEAIAHDDEVEEPGAR